MTDAVYDNPGDVWDGRRQAIPLTDRDIEDAKRLLSLLAHADQTRTRSEADSGSGRRLSQTELQRRALRIFDNRQRRLQIFGADMFGEPAWDMLLILYIAQGASRQTARRLAEVAGTSRSTGKRWIEHLERDGLVSREAHPTDKRSTFVELTEHGKGSLDLYLSGTADAGG